MYWIPSWMVLTVPLAIVTVAGLLWAAIERAIDKE